MTILILENAVGIFSQMFLSLRGTRVAQKGSWDRSVAQQLCTTSVYCTKVL